MVNCPTCGHVELSEIDHTDIRWTCDKCGSNFEDWDNEPCEFIGIIRASDIIRLRTKYPDNMCTEWCPHCNEEVDIPAYERSKCPNCGEDILPCSMCDCRNFDVCPFE